MSKAIQDVINERQRQISVEGHTPELDDKYDTGELAEAAGCYALHAHDEDKSRKTFVPAWWPWDKAWWKPKTTRTDLVRAAALIIAEIERLDRKGN